jgi:Ca-activated chloride channel family protein
VTWSLPHLLWLLPALIALGALRWWWRRVLLRRHAGIGAGLAAHTPGVGRRRERLRGACLALGLAAGALALAGPQWGARDDLERGRGYDLLVALDCSRSMLATDLYPDRMEAARRKALRLVELGADTRLALLPFAALPVLRCPPSGDRAVLAELLGDCSPELFPAESGLQGTAIGAAVREGLTVLARQVERGQAILVVSDGIDPDTAAVEAAAAAAKAAGVPVCGLFIGDPERPATVTIDGRTQQVQAQRTTLEQLAAASGGLVVDATLDDTDVLALRAHLDRTVAKGGWQEHRRSIAAERYQWLLVPALALLALGALLPTRRRFG